MLAGGQMKFVPATLAVVALVVGAFAQPSRQMGSTSVMGTITGWNNLGGRISSGDYERRTDCGLSADEPFVLRSQS